MELGGLYVESGLDFTRLDKDIKIGTETVAKAGDAMAARFRDSTAGKVAEVAADMARAYGEGTTAVIGKVREMGTAVAGEFEGMGRKAKDAIQGTLQDTRDWVAEHKVLLGTLAVAAAGVWAYNNQETLKEYWSKAKAATAEGVATIKGDLEQLSTAAEPYVRQGFASVFDAAAEASVRHSATLVDLAESYDKLSSYTGRSIDDLQTMGQTAKYTGVSVDSLTGMLDKVAVAQSGSSDEAKRAAAQFAVFGVRLKDAGGQARSEIAVLTDLINAEAKFGDGAKKIAAERAIFGEQLNKDTHSLLTHASTWNTVQREIARINGLMTQDELNYARKYKAQKDQEAAEAQIWAQKDQAVYLRRSEALSQIAEDLLSGQTTVGQAFARGWSAYMDSWQAFAANYLAQHETLARVIQATVDHAGLPLVDWLQRQADGVGALSGNLVEMAGDLAGSFVRALGDYLAKSDQEMADALRGNAFERLRWGVANAIAEGTVNLIKAGKEQLEALGNWLTGMLDALDKAYGDLQAKEREMWSTLKNADYAYPDIVTSNSWDGYEPGSAATSAPAAASAAAAEQARTDSEAYQGFWGSAIEYLAGKSDQFVAAIGQAGLADKFQAEADATKTVYDDLASRLESRTQTLAESMTMSLGGVLDSFRSGLSTLGSMANTAVTIASSREKLSDAYVNDAIAKVNRFKGGAVGPRVVPAKDTGSGSTSTDLAKLIGDIKNSALAEQLSLFGDAFGAKAQTNVKNYEHSLAELQKKLESYEGADKAALEAAGKYWIEYRKGIADARVELEKWKDSMSFWADINDKIGAVTGSLENGLDAALIRLQTESVATRQKLQSIFDSNDKVTWDDTVNAASQAGADVVGIWADADAQLQVNAEARDAAMAKQTEYESLAETQIRENALGDMAAMDQGYWAKRKDWLEKNLEFVKQNCADENAYEVYAAEQRSELRKKELEEEEKYAGSFGEVLAAKWSLAFGGYEDATTKAKKRWDSMADGMVEATDGMIEGVSGGIGDLIRNIGNGTASIEDLWRNMLARMLDAFAGFVEKLVLQQLEDLVGGLFSGSGSGGLSLSSLTGSKSSGGSLGDGLDAIKTLGDYVGKSSGNAIGDYLTTAASSGNTLFLGGGNALSDIFAEGIDVSSLGKFSTDYFSVGTEAVASTYSAAETAAMAGTSVLGTIGSVLGVVGAIGGVVGLLSGLFGEQKEEIKKVASGYNVQYAGGKTVTSGVDFYSDGSVVGTGVGDPDVTKKISDAFKDAAENLSDFADVLGFTVDVLDGFRMPSMNITDDQLDGYIRNGTNAMAFQALEQAGLRGAFDMLAEDGEVYIDQIERLATAYSTGAGKLSAYGYEMGQVAQVTQDQIEALRTQTIETAAGTSDAVMAMAQSMGATSAQLAELAANASDGSQALAVTDEQLSNLLEADWMSKVLDNVGGEDAFNAVMDTLLSNVFDSVEAYAENLGYYGSKASTAIAKLGDASITIDNFWDKFNAALKAGLDPDQFELWAKASTWVNSIDSVTKALADWNDAMVQASQSLDVRLLKARGLDYEAELTQLAADAEWELADAREAGYDAAVIARIQEVQAAELAAKIAEHVADYAAKLRDANKRYAEAVGDSSALVEIAIQENALELAELAKTFNWSPGSSEEGLFQATQRAQWAEIINMIQETADALADSTRAMRADLDARKAAIAGYDEEAEAIQMVAGYADELSQAIKDGLDEDLIAELMQVQIDELAKYWADALEGMRADLEDLYRQQSDLLDSLSGNTKSAIEELYALFARYQAGEEDLADDIIDSLKSIGQAIDAMVEDIYATIYEIRTGDSYTTDDAATVAANSKAYFEEQYALAASGDTEAMANVTSYAKDYLTSLRSSTADQSVYQSGVDYVTSMLSQLGASGTAIGGNLTGIGETVTDDQIEAAREALHRAEVAQLKSKYDALWTQTLGAFQGSDVAKYIQGLATTGIGWQGLTDLFADYEGDGQTRLQEIQSGKINYVDYIGWFQSNYGTGTGYVDWGGALQLWKQYAALPSSVSSLYDQSQTAYDSWQALKTQYGFATGGMIEGGIPGEDSVFVLGKPGEAVLTERQTDMLLLLAERIQGVMLGGAAPAMSGRDDLAAEVAELRREVVRQGDRLRQTQERLVENSQAVVSMLTRCGGKEGNLMVVTS